MASKRRPDPEEKMEGEESFIRQNGGNLLEVDRMSDYGASRDILDSLIGDGMRDALLLRLIAKCANQRELFTQLRAHHERSGTRDDFTEAVFLLPPETWEQAGGSLSEHLFDDLASRDPNLPRRLAKSRRTKGEETMRAVITASAHPLFGKVDFTPYWSARVRHFIKRRNFKRAWDALRQAQSGFLISDREPDSHEEQDMKAFRADPKNRCCRASNGALRELVSELFEAMVRAGAIKRLAPEDYAAPAVIVIRRVWQPTGKGKGRFMRREFDNPWPAKRLVLAVGGICKASRAVSESFASADGSATPLPEGTVCFRELSAEAYKMARHFQEIERAKRAARKQMKRAASAQAPQP
jgi:hypothetical protein